MKNIKGRDVLQKEYPDDGLKMRIYMKCLQDDKDALIKSMRN